MARDPTPDATIPAGEKNTHEKCQDIARSASKGTPLLALRAGDEYPVSKRPITLELRVKTVAGHLLNLGQDWALLPPPLPVPPLCFRWFQRPLHPPERSWRSKRSCRLRSAP